MQRKGEINPRDKAIKAGIDYAEINEFFARELQTEGYSGMEMMVNKIPIEITVRVSKTHEVLGEKKSRIKQIRNLICRRLGVPENGVEILVEMVRNKNLCAMTQAETIRAKLAEGIPFRRAVNAAVKSIKEGGGLGSMIVVSGKLRGQRAKSMKFVDGLLVHSGQPREEFMREAMTSVKLRLGVIGIKVGIMLPYDKDGINGPSKEIADKIRVFEPKDEI